MTREPQPPLSAQLVGSHTVRYVRTGHGPPLLLLHNAGTAHAIWQPQIDRFAREYDVIALDLLGFGASDKPEATYDARFYRSMLEGFVDALDLRNVTLIGNCVGSAIAIAFAAAHPDNVRRLVVMNVETDFALEGGDFAAVLWLSNRSRAARKVLRFAARSLPIPQKLLAHAATRQFRGDSDPEMERYLADLYRDRANLRVLMSILEHMDTFVLPDVTATPLPPTCLIWGRRNTVLPVSGASRVADAIHPAEMHVVEDAGHLVAREQPDRVNELVSAFLRRHDI